MFNFKSALCLIWQEYSLICVSLKEIFKKKKIIILPKDSIFLPQCFPEGTDMVAILDFYFQVTDFKIETHYKLRNTIISSRSWFVHRYEGFNGL